MAIPKSHMTNFNTMMVAAKNGDLALMECTDAKTGDPRYVIVAVRRDGEEFVMIPFGHLCMGNPYDEYLPPESLEEVS